MAAAFFNTLANPARARAISAGTRPGTAVHPEVVTAMRELGIDLSAATPQYLSTDLAKDAHIVITMGCGDECPLDPRRRARRLAAGRSERTAGRNGAADTGRDQEESGGVGEGEEVGIVQSRRVQSRQESSESRHDDWLAYLMIIVNPSAARQRIRMRVSSIRPSTTGFGVRNSGSIVSTNPSSLIL